MLQSFLADDSSHIVLNSPIAIVLKQNTIIDFPCRLIPIYAIVSKSREMVIDKDLHCVFSGLITEDFYQEHAWKYLISLRSYML